MEGEGEGGWERERKRGDGGEEMERGEGTKGKVCALNDRAENE